MHTSKSLCLLAIVSLFVFSSFAQYENRSATELSTKRSLDYHRKSLSEGNLGDTTIFYGNAPTLYKVQGDSGWVAGTNLFGDVAKWQRFDVGQSSLLKSFSLYFGTYKIVNTADQIQVTVREAAGSGPTDAPGNLLYSDDMTVDQMDTLDKNTFSLAGENVNVPASFYIGVEWEGIDDSFSLYLDQADNGDSAYRAWEKWSDGSLHPFLIAWSGLDTDLFIEATVSYATDGKYKANMQKPFTLKQNYPNPFYTSTTIEFQIALKSDVFLDIYNTKGERIKQLYNGTLFPDKYKFTWDCIDENGRFVSSGVYYIVLTNDRNGFISQVKKKMFLLK